MARLILGRLRSLGGKSEISRRCQISETPSKIIHLSLQISTRFSEELSDASIWYILSSLQYTKTDKTRKWKNLYSCERVAGMQNERRRYNYPCLVHCPIHNQENAQTSRLRLILIVPKDFPPPPLLFFFIDKHPLFPLSFGLQPPLFRIESELLRRRM